MKKKIPKDKKDLYMKRALSLLLGLVAVFILIFIIFYTVSRVFRPQDIAQLLPKENVIGFVQVNVNVRNDHVEHLYNELTDYEVYHPNNIKLYINELLDLDYDKDLHPWLNRQVGMAMLEKEEKGDADYVYFVETRNKEETLKFMESRGLKSENETLLTEEYKSETIYRYSLSHAIKFTFINSYMVLSESDEALKKLIEVNKNVNNRLTGNEKYIKVAQNLPVSRLVFAYFDMNTGIEYLKNNEVFMAEKGRELLAFDPFLKLYKAFGFSVIMENGNAVMQTYLNFNEENFEEEDFLNFENKFRADLLKFVKKDVLLYAGGLNLQKQFVKISQVFNAGGEVSYLIFEGMINAFKTKYLGDEISLEADIYPLLQKEYAFVLNGNDEKKTITMIIKLTDPENDKEKIKNIVDSFVRKSALLAPKIIEVEDEDGNITEEIEAVSEEIVPGTEEYLGYEINNLDLGNLDWGIHYLIIDDNLIVSSNLDSLKSSIDLYVNSTDSFKNQMLYKEIISPIIRTSDEAIYIDLDFVFRSLDGFYDPVYKAYLEPFKGLSVGRNYFKDGISGIYHIKID